MPLFPSVIELGSGAMDGRLLYMVWRGPLCYSMRSLGGGGYVGDHVEEWGVLRWSKMDCSVITKCI